MIWPSTLVNAALFNTMHSSYGTSYDGRISRERFFTYFFIGSFLWYWVPGYLFTALSTFSFICWAAPKNVVLNQVNFPCRLYLGRFQLFFTAWL
jgi:OPT oligopeptide transporter protein